MRDRALSALVARDDIAARGRRGRQRRRYISRRALGEELFDALGELFLQLRMELAAGRRSKPAGRVRDSYESERYEPGCNPRVTAAVSAAVCAARCR